VTTEAATGAPVGWTVHRHATIGSTMDAARALEREGAPDRAAVRADEQTAGRGRQGRHWVSKPGNLYVTILLREARPLGDCAILSFVAALALREACGLPEARLKWPNDVLIRGKKLSGLLLEGAGTDGTTSAVLIGMGVNVAHHPDEALYPTTDLVSEGGETDLDALCHALLDGIDRWRAVWHKRGAEAIRRAWLDHAAGLGETLTARAASESVTGVFEGLDETGALILLDGSGKRRVISAADVFLGRGENG
jgi:BirA family biotin operon repressor/biotin-[acetyl-CoA-carboxylase] ligase